MANEVLIKRGSVIVWADATDYVDPSAGGVLTRTHQLDLTSLANAAARQGAKADLGALRAQRYAVYARLEFDVAPAAGNLVSVWLSESPEAIASEINPGGCSGSDGVYTGYAGGALADSIKQLTLAGVFTVENVVAPTVQFQKIGVLENLERYISPVVYNETDQAFEGDAVEMLIALIPVIDEIQ